MEQNKNKNKTRKNYTWISNQWIWQKGGAKDIKVSKWFFDTCVFTFKIPVIFWNDFYSLQNVAATKTIFRAISLITVLGK